LSFDAGATKAEELVWKQYTDTAEQGARSDESSKSFGGIEHCKALVFGWRICENLYATCI
jgi:hypothetical protein